MPPVYGAVTWVITSAGYIHLWHAVQGLDPGAFIGGLAFSEESGVRVVERSARGSPHGDA